MEMLCDELKVDLQTPFWANNHADMYVRVLQDELTFPEDRTMDQDTKSLLRGVSGRGSASKFGSLRF
jgi:serum/glucocorticoid-regulated kinase 2